MLTAGGRKMLTEFGKALRKLRLDYGEVLKDMAGRLNISSSYLSAIEVGKRAIPGDMVKRLAALYGLAAAPTRELERARDQCLKEVTVKFGDSAPQKREVALLFARKFDDLDDKAVLEIREFFNRTRKEK